MTLDPRWIAKVIPEDRRLDDDEAELVGYIIEEVILRVIERAVGHTDFREDIWPRMSEWDRREVVEELMERVLYDDDPDADRLVTVVWRKEVRR